MQLQRKVIEKRYDDFPDSIKEVAMFRPEIRRCMDAYAHGDVITKEEVLCRMIVLLNDSIELYKTNEANLLMKSPSVYQPPEI